MSKYTADEVEKMAAWVSANGLSTGNAVPMLRELARRLRQQEEENKRDPVTDPRPGDRVKNQRGYEFIFHDCDSTAVDDGNWRNICESKSATIIRRREVQ